MTMRKVDQALTFAMQAAPLVGPVAHQFRQFTPPNDRVWNRLTMLPAERAPYTLGDKGEDEYTGVYQVDLYGKVAQGRLTLWERADQLLSFFRAGVAMSYAGQEVKVLRGTASGIRLEDPDTLVVSVSLFWRALVKRGDDTLPDLSYTPSTAAFGYIHTQSTASAEWVINHNLGYRPVVELLDASGNEFDADVTHPTLNQTRVTMNVALAGSARLL